MKINDYKPESFDANESIRNQLAVWGKGNPQFAPSDGYCWYCRTNIYAPKFWKCKNFRRIEVPANEANFATGIMIEQSKKLITACPHCRKTYCD